MLLWEIKDFIGLLKIEGIFITPHIFQFYFDMALQTYQYLLGIDMRMASTGRFCVDIINPKCTFYLERNLP